ncbi:hypothetical protein ACX84Q_17295, partial [Burkholderia pseudomallei]
MREQAARRAGGHLAPREARSTDRPDGRIDDSTQVRDPADRRFERIRRGRRARDDDARPAPGADAPP